MSEPDPYTPAKLAGTKKKKTGFIMSAVKNRPILISGAPRSGSTWVGKILNLSQVVGYLHEPFNPSYKNTIYPGKIDEMYLHISGFNEEEYLDHFLRQVNFDCRPTDFFQVLTNTRHLRNSIGEYRRIRNCNKSGYRALLKDPIALFSSEWIAESLQADVLILIRHPAAFVSSVLNKQGWRTDFKVIMKQKELMERFDLYRYEEDMIEETRLPTATVMNHALSWKIFYDVVYQLQQKYTDWLFIKYEDISSDPVKYYKQIFEKFSLPFTAETEQEIISYSSSDNKTSSAGIFDVKINSKANIKKWKQQLNDETVEEIRTITAEVADKYYTDSDW